MSAGELRHLIEIQSETRTVDAGGGAVSTWATITNGQRWAQMRSATSGEVFAAEQLQERVTHVWKIRYLSTVTTAMRISYSSRVFHLQGIVDLEEKHVWQILRTEERKAS